MAFNKQDYVNDWKKKNMKLVGASYKAEFVEEFKKACNILDVSQSELIRKMMESTIEKAKIKEKKIMNEREEMLRNWNEEEEREDTIYLVEVWFYKHVEGLGYSEEGFDPCVCRTNDLAEAEKVFEDQKYYHEKELVKIQIERALQVYENNLEYEVIKEYSTLDPKIRIGNF